MSWRRFRALYAGLSPRSATFRNYDRIAKKCGANRPEAERAAWDAMTGLAKPRAY